MFIIIKMFKLKINNKNSSIFIIPFIFITLFFFYFILLDTVNIISTSGYSQIEAINLLSGELESNSYAYISTAEAKKSSLLTWVYYGISKIFQISGLNLIVFFKFLEFLIIPFSAKFLLDSLKIDHSLQKSVIFLGIPVLSTVAYNNWANYGQIFNGEWYQFPHYLYFFCIGFILKKNYINSIFILLIIYLIHPAKGVALIIVSAPIILQLIYKNKNNLNLKKHYLFIFSVGIVSGVFTFFILPSANTLMKNSLWVAITKVHNFHMLQGTFNLEFIIFSLLPIVILSVGIFQRLKTTDLKYLIFSLLTVSLVGKLYDSFGSNPDILKLVLHRTTENIILLSILLIVSRLKKLNYKFEVLELGSFYVLIYKFNIFAINYKMILFGTIYLILLIIYKEKKDITLTLTYYLLIFQSYFFNEDIFYILVVSFLIMLFRNDNWNRFMSFEYSAPFFLIFFILTRFGNSAEINLFNISYVSIYLLLFILFTFAFHTFKLKNFISLVLVAGLSTVFIFVNIYGFKLSTEKLENIFSQRTNGYYEAQIWSRNNTPTNSIFFPDPQISYAWRDFSNRNSFGTPREFVTTWLYSQNQELFNDSRERLGVFVDDPINTMLTWDKVDYINYISGIYYSSDLKLYKELADDWKVDYFIWSKEFDLPTFFNVIYETNSHYILKLN